MFLIKLKFDRVRIEAAIPKLKTDAQQKPNSIKMWYAAFFGNNKSIFFFLEKTITSESMSGNKNVRTIARVAVALLNSSL